MALKSVVKDKIIFTGYRDEIFRSKMDWLLRSLRVELNKIFDVLKLHLYCGMLFKSFYEVLHQGKTNE